MEGTTSKQIAFRANTKLADRLQRDADADNLHVSAHIRRLLSAAIKLEDDAAANRRRRLGRDRTLSNVLRLADAIGLTQAARSRIDAVGSVAADASDEFLDPPTRTN